MTSASPGALTATGLSKRYGRHEPLALRDVHLSVVAGSITALVGPNGAGKSTLMRTWMGFEHPSAGAVTVLGIDPARDRVGALADVAYLAQVPALYLDLSVSDHLDLVARYRRHSFDRSRAESRLDELGVPRGARARSLSGGQAAQLGLALAIGLRARVILLDEPLASLDPLARREFIDVLLDDARASGSTVVLSSHIVSDLELACDRLVVLGGGRVALDEAIETIRRTHWLVEQPDGSDDVVALVPGDPRRSVVRRAEARADASPAGLEDVVMAYLIAFRGGGV
jgi:ABC-2 type transport system ATP-binding protein